VLMGDYTITTLSERWRDWAIPKHNKCSRCKKQLGPDEIVGIEDFENDYASASCLDCTVSEMDENIETLKDAITTIKDIQLKMGRD
jgi:hypothetical protein